MAPKVAIVGAGLSGLTALKHCLEEGFNATVFETRHAIGGQWLFEEPDPVTGKTSTSIYPGVLLNSCRDTSFFSDFPIDPAQYPDYFGHLKMLRYLESYADHFGLREHIRFGTKILSCSQGKDGRWDVKIAQEGADTIEDAYDAVFACSGALYQPAVPEFEGLQAFKGRVFHSRTYRRPSGFEGKRIAIIGFGNSAADLSSELCCQASEVHLITRRGGWVIPRFFLGKPVEAYDNRVFETLLPHRFSQWCQTRITNHAQGKLPGAIQPEHGLMEANVTMRSDLVENIKTGRIIPHRAGVERITETSMVLTDGVSIEVDVIICCTGYHLSVPYVPEESYRMKYNEILNTSNSMDLYKLVASPDFPNLFFIGFVELAGPVIPVSEAQVRWATSVIAGRVNLPSASNMYASIARFQGHIASRFVKSDRHAVTIRYLPYCDDLLKDIGANPTFFRLLSKIMTSNPVAAIRLLMAVYLGVNSPAQYRLFGPGRKANLASAILLRIAREAGELSDKEKEYLELDSQQRAQSSTVEEAVPYPTKYELSDSTLQAKVQPVISMIRELVSTCFRSCHIELHNVSRPSAGDKKRSIDILYLFVDDDSCQGEFASVRDEVKFLLESEGLKNINVEIVDEARCFCSSAFPIMTNPLAQERFKKAVYDIVPVLNKRLFNAWCYLNLHQYGTKERKAVPVIIIGVPPAAVCDWSELEADLLDSLSKVYPWTLPDIEFFPADPRVGLL
ncbi:hypothetical protein LOZ61_006618 [Ophidiomyces ophidiicola]|nr:hypothetical protein LOZ61_006618 [Ophidiomyces ophidiicola]KAI2365811.1 hypothetical protein LOY89_006193 [Ophidiomyces ophidiicola]KAI2393978.1 hypothetical protein LOY90_005572 [Ophidiomyces ophidiicola]